MNQIKYFRYVSGLIAAFLLAIAPLFCLAAVPQQSLWVRDLTPQERLSLNSKLRTDFQTLHKELTVQFGSLLRQTSMMGFFQDRSRASTLVRTRR